MSSQCLSNSKGGKSRGFPARGGFSTKRCNSSWGAAGTFQQHLHPCGSFLVTSGDLWGLTAVWRDQRRWAGYGCAGFSSQVCNSPPHRYRNQYPILGLLSDDYKVTSPVNKSQTIVIERTGEIWKHVSSPRDRLFRLWNSSFSLTSKKVSAEADTWDKAIVFI